MFIKYTCMFSVLASHDASGKHNDTLLRMLNLQDFGIQLCRQQKSTRTCAKPRCQDAVSVVSVIMPVTPRIADNFTRTNPSVTKLLHFLPNLHKLLLLIRIIVDRILLYKTSARRYNNIMSVPPDTQSTETKKDTTWSPVVQE